MVVAEVPVTLATRKPRKQQSPQENIDEFWSKFTTKTPGKGMSRPASYVSVATSLPRGSSDSPRCGLLSSPPEPYRG